VIQKSALTNLTKPMALMRFNEARTKPGAVVEMIEQSDHLWTVTIVWDDAEEVGFQDLEAFDETLSAPALATATATAAPAAASASEEVDLGQLSRRFESNGKPGAIGFDTKGGFSYGTYQIATKTGTMKAFIEFLSVNFSAFANALQEAGGTAQALAGTATFKDAWISLATDPEFAVAQHKFIEETHYKPFARKILVEQAFDVATRTAVLRDVVWSVAVQHGPANPIFRNALQGSVASNLDDHQIIVSVYAERSNVQKYFPSSTDQVRKALTARFAEELSNALTRLGNA